MEESVSCFSEMEKFDFVKFFALIPSGILRDEMLIPEDVLEKNNARRYIFSEQNDEIYRDIQYHPLMNFTSTVFSAIHFAMYTRPERIILVGCDCAGIEHFDGRVGLAEEDIPIWISGYRKIKKFVKRNYSNLEIISINPVGLKGMFRDMYTESYLEAHPEIDRSECEILD